MSGLETTVIQNGTNDLRNNPENSNQGCINQPTSNYCKLPSLSLLTEFSGNDDQDVLVWLELADKIFNFTNTKYRDRLIEISGYLNGEAKKFYESLRAKNEKLSWREFQESFKQKYSPKAESEKLSFPMTIAFVNGNPIQVKISTGTITSILPKSFVEKHKIRVMEKEHPYQDVMNNILSLGKTEKLTLIVDNHICQLEFVVTNRDDGVLGIDWLNLANASAGYKFFFNEKEIPMNLRDKSDIIELNYLNKLE